MIRFLRRPRGVVADEGGLATVEFGIVALPFFMLLFAIFQTGLLFFQQEVFQTAISDAGRLIFTGQADAAGYTQAQFKQQVCNRLPSIVPCGSVTVDVRTYATFATAQPHLPVDSSGNYDPTKATYSAGNPDSIVVVTGFAAVPVLFPMNPGFQTAGAGKALISSSAAFRNEPYNSQSGS